MIQQQIIDNKLISVLFTILVLDIWVCIIGFIIAGWQFEWMWKIVMILLSMLSLSATSYLWIIWDLLISKEFKALIRK